MTDIDQAVLSAQTVAGTAGTGSASLTPAVRGVLEAIKLSWVGSLITNNNMSVVVSNRTGEVLLSVTGSASAVSTPFYRPRVPSHAVSGAVASGNTGFATLEKPFVFDPVLSLSGMDASMSVTATLYMLK